jgi:hypothetical protein
MVTLQQMPLSGGRNASFQAKSEDGIPAAGVIGRRHSYFWSSGGGIRGFNFLLKFSDVCPIFLKSVRSDSGSQGTFLVARGPESDR